MNINIEIIIVYTSLKLSNLTVYLLVCRVYWIINAKKEQSEQFYSNLDVEGFARQLENPHYSTTSFDTVFNYKIQTTVFAVTIQPYISGKK